MKAYITINFPLRTAFAVSHRFYMVVFSLLFVSRYILISFLISSLTHWFFSSMLFSLQLIVLFSFLFLWLISNFMTLWSEKMLKIISVLLNLLRLVLCPRMWSALENVLCALKKNVYSVFCGVLLLLLFLDVVS